MRMRIGMGYDVHRLVQGRDLIIGGVNIPHEKGLLGHSDADVLLHAIMDALLGASSLGDIGKHFPDTDDSYKGISSVKLLEHVGKLLEEHCFFIENIPAFSVFIQPLPARAKGLGRRGRFLRSCKLFCEKGLTFGATSAILTKTRRNAPLWRAPGAKYTDKTDE